ncbi:hypothetical protein FXO37_07943 [Capsicum annuum]|nr:hypothetical protein FXO37_07943 [Capsicum annuum]
MSSINLLILQDEDPSSITLSWAKLANLEVDFSISSSLSSIMGVFDESANQDEDDAIIRIAATFVLAAGVAILVAYEHNSSIPREPYVNKDQEREFYMNSILNGSDVHCVGHIRIRAIDGTHVIASVSIEQQNRFRGWKGTTQNILASINFNLKFMYVLAGWEGSAHDSRILNYALERPHDKYYLVDAGYGLRKGFIPPYHGIRYHLQEYCDCHSQNEKELFNLRHASLRSSVERAFTILKRRFPMDMKLKYFDYKISVNESSLIQQYPPEHQAHPDHDKFINKKIKIFDEMSLVCGNDRARKDCAKSFEAIDFDSFFEKDNDNDIEGPSIENDVQVTKASQIKASCKRKHSFEVQDVVGDISIKFGEVATAIGRMVDSRLDVTKLYEEVMAMDGYNEVFLGDVFDIWCKATL